MSFANPVDRGRVRRKLGDGRPPYSSARMDYRLYIFAGGHIQKAVVLEAEDDAQAIALAKPLCISSRAELWHLGRVVETFGEGASRSSSS